MAYLVSIGNSKGVRLPKQLIEQAQLEDKELEFKILPEGILIHPIKKVREGWAEQFTLMATQAQSTEDKEWLNADLSTHNNDDDWTW